MIFISNCIEIKILYYKEIFITAGILLIYQEIYWPIIKNHQVLLEVLNAISDVIMIKVVKIRKAILCVNRETEIKTIR